MKRLALGLVGATGGLLLLVLGRTLWATPTDPAQTVPVEHALNRDRIVEHLSAAIRIPTISHEDPAQRRSEPFANFVSWVAHTYPDIEAALEKRLFGHTMLYIWPGSNPDLQPILLTGHYDVVPIDPSSADDWLHPPFAGVVADGSIWGRGTLDDKSGVVGILEAVSYLLARDFKPSRTVYLSFGHDEEISGHAGAGAVAAYLAKEKVRLAWSLDEGSFLLDGLIPGIHRPVAVINLAEKGDLTLELRAKGAGGHSSMPPKQTAVGTLARALVKLQEHPMPGGLEGLAQHMFADLTPHMDFFPRVFFANQWLFSPLIVQQLEGSPTTNAILRTTIAPTVLRGSPKANVLPSEALALVNFRLHPRDSSASVTHRVKELLQSDALEVHVRESKEPSPVSSSQAEGFQVIRRAVREVYGPVPVAPGLMVGGSDSRHYGKVADNAYRFNPFPVTAEDIDGFHGTNEHLRVDYLLKGIQSYIQILHHAAGTTAASAGQ